MEGSTMKKLLAVLFWVSVFFIASAVVNSAGAKQQTKTTYYHLTWYSVATDQFKNIVLDTHPVVWCVEFTRAFPANTCRVIWYTEIPRPVYDYFLAHAEIETLILLGRY